MGTITQDVVVGQEFSCRTKTVSWPRLWTFSGGPFAAEGWPRKNVHTDLAFAQGTGLPSVAVSGTQCQGYLCDLMIDLFGEEWLSQGQMNIKFVKPIPEGDRLVAKAKVQSKEEGGETKISFEVWCENQNGEKAVVGTASGIVSRGRG